MEDAAPVQELFVPTSFFTGRDPVEPTLGRPRCLNAESHVGEAREYAVKG